MHASRSTPLPQVAQGSVLVLKVFHHILHVPQLHLQAASIQLQPFELPLQASNVGLKDAREAAALG